MNLMHSCLDFVKLPELDVLIEARCSNRAFIRTRHSKVQPPAKVRGSLNGSSKSNGSSRSVKSFSSAGSLRHGEPGLLSRFSHYNSNSASGGEDSVHFRPRDRRARIGDRLRAVHAPQLATYDRVIAWKDEMTTESNNQRVSSGSERSSVNSGDLGKISMRVLLWSPRGSTVGMQTGVGLSILIFCNTRCRLFPS